MSLRDALLPVADTLRSLASPFTLAGDEGLDVRPHELSIITRTWPGVVGDPNAAPTDVVLEIAPRPDIEQLSPREVSESGGLYEMGDLRASGITPAYAAGGYTPEQLAPAIETNGIEVIYQVSGPLAGHYARVALHRDEAFEYSLILRRRAQ